MTTFQEIDICDIDENLLKHLSRGWKLYKAPYEKATNPNQYWQIIYNDEEKRGGIVFCGSGASGVTDWTDADSPEDVLERYMSEDQHLMLR
jgi:hypothetical protein